MGILSWLIFIPFLTALAVALTPSLKSVRWIALAGTGLHLLLTLFTTIQFWILASPGPGVGQTDLFTKLYLVERMDWFRTLGIEYFLGVDGISMSMVVLTSVIIFTGVLASWKVEHRRKEFFALLLTLVTGVFGVFLSFDLFLFFIFEELHGTFTSLEIETGLDLFFRLIDGVIDLLEIYLGNDVEGG